MLRQLSKSLRNYSTASAVKSLPKSSDIIIIGGGVIGLSTAYHLTKLGCKNVIILERNIITSGTTWHSNGLVWRLRPSDIDIQLLTRTREFIGKELLAYDGVETTGFINNGGLFLAHNQERIREYQRIHGMAKYFGIESHMMNRNQIMEMLNPLIDTNSDLIGGLLSPGDGYVDPTQYCNAMKKAGDLNVFEDCNVIGISTKPINGIGQNRKVTSVRVKYGNNEEEINTDIVINSSGVWAPIIATMAGIKDMPQETFEHGYLCTQPIEHVSPLLTPNIRDHDLSIAFRVSGKTFQISYYESGPFNITDKTASIAPFSQFDFNWDRASENLESTTKLMPIISKVGIKGTICGPESFTPDHKPLLGEDFDVRGFYYASGFNSFGICMSGGCGQQLANWIVKGRPELDMFAYDIRRFNRNLIGNKEWNKNRCRESYALNYSIVYPYDEPICERETAHKDPLTKLLDKYGAVYQERHGRLRPGWFDDVRHPKLTLNQYLQLNNSFVFDPNSRLWAAVKREYNACLNSSVIFSLSSMGKFMIEGADATPAMQWLVPNDIASLTDGSSVSTFLLDSGGGIVSEVTIHKITSNRYYLISGDISATRVHNHLLQEIDRKNFNGVKVDDVTDKMGILSIHGPNSKTVIEQALGIKLDSIDINHHNEIELNDMKLRVMNMPQFTKMGFELHSHIKSLETIYKLIMDHGEKSNDIINGGWRTYEALRMDNGRLTWGIEVRSDDKPLYYFDHSSNGTSGLHSLNLLRVNCSREKRESLQFLGASELKNVSRNKKYYILMHLKDQSIVPQGLEPIYLNGNVIGMVRSGTYSFSNNCPIAIGYIYGERVCSDTVPIIAVVDIHINGKSCKACIKQKY